MGLDRIYDRDGQPITVAEWGRLSEDYDYKRVDLTEIGPYVVSTVWLGLDHSFTEGPPVIFETMVFTSSAWHEERPWDDPDHEPLLEIEGRRYSTEEEAIQGHSETVLLIRATWDPDAPVQPSEAENGHSEA